jgi:hypothetical protein
MEFRYMGFDQRQNARAFRFDVLVKGEPPKHVVITADLGLFLAHHIGIQEGPSLCARKLATDLAESPEGTHELTDSDLRTHAAELASEVTRRAEARKAAPRRPAPGAQEQSPWRNFGI